MLQSDKALENRALFKMQFDVVSQEKSGDQMPSRGHGDPAAAPRRRRIDPRLPKRRLVRLSHGANAA